MELNLGIVGLGRLGLTQAACYAASGHRVLGVDTDPARVAALRSGQVPFHEPGLDEVVAAEIDRGRLRFTTSFRDVARYADTFVLAVGTPSLPDADSADLSQVHAAVDALVPMIRAGSVVLGKSTVPVGTARSLRARLRAHGVSAELAWCPEFLREGSAVSDALNPDRIVVGVDEGDELSVQRVRHLYASQIGSGTPLFVTDFETSELVKQAANSFLAMKVSFINAVSSLCERTGADIAAISAILGADARIGHGHLRSGIGYGGGCLPKDLRALGAVAAELGIPETVELLRGIESVNVERRRRAVHMVSTALGGDVKGRRITLAGAGFKESSDDLRESPSLEVARALRRLGARVRVFDCVMSGDDSALDGLEIVADPQEACAGADVVVALGASGPDGLDPEAVSDLVSSRRLVTVATRDDLSRWHASGWSCYALGIRDPEEAAARPVGAGSRPSATVR